MNIYIFLEIFCKSQAIASINNGTLRLDEFVFLLIFFVNKMYFRAELLSQRYRLAIQKTIKFLEDSNKYDIQTKEELGNNLLSAQIILSLFDAVSMRPTGFRYFF